jgi:hypothetical protein
MIARIWQGRTSRADAENCQQHLDGQATAVMARSIAGLRSVDILRREVAGDEVEFTTILMFDDWAPWTPSPVPTAPPR